MIVKIKRKDSFTYCVRIYVAGKRISKTFKRKVDAEMWERSQLCRRDANLPIVEEKLEVIESVSVSEFVDRWLREKVDVQLSPSTQYGYRSDLKLHILPVIGNLKMDQIHVTHANKIVSNMRQMLRTPKTINGVLGTLKAMLFDALRWDVITKHPLLNVRPLKGQAQNDTYWTDAEIEQFLAVNWEDPLILVYVFALNTGLRRGEICALKWDRVSFQRNQIEITRTTGRFGLRETTKSGKKRVIPMNDTVRSILFELRKDQKSEFVFTNRKGDPVDASHLYRDFQLAQDRAGFQNKIRFHDLRHTFASHFMMKGGNIYDLQKILGHYNLDMTQRYAHLSPLHLANAVQIINFGRDRQQIVNKTKLEKKKLIISEG